MVRETVAARRAEWELFRVLRATLLVFAVLSAGTFCLFALRDYRVAMGREKIRAIAFEMENEGIDMERVVGLGARNSELDLRLGVLHEVLSDTASWSRVLATLGGMCEATQIKLRRIHTDTRGTVASLYLEGICTAPDPVRSVRKFLENVSREEAFGGGELRTIDMESGEYLFLYF